MTTLAERLTDLTIENMRLKDTIGGLVNRCIEIAATEAIPNGPVPSELRNISPEELVVAVVGVTRRNIANRIAKEFGMADDSIKIELSYGTLQKDGRDISSVFVKCTKCGHSVSSFGTTERSIHRCCALLREQCPRKEKNFYELRE